MVNHSWLSDETRMNEMTMLSGMIRDASNVPDVCDIISQEDLVFDFSQKIFKAILAAWSRDPSKKGVNPLAVTEELKKNQDIENIGGYQFIAQIMDLDPSGMYCRQCAEIARNTSMLRRLYYLTQEINQAATSGSQSADDLIVTMQQEAAKFGVKSNSKALLTFKDVLEQSMDEIERRCANKGQPTGISSGLIDLDEITAGFQNGELIVLAARPSVGKTALIGNIIRNSAERGSSSLFFPLEQRALEIGIRMMCSESGVDATRVRHGRLNAEELQSLVEAKYKMQNFKIFWQDDASQRVRNIAATARRMVANDSVKMIAIDYLQLIMTEKGQANREQQVSEFSRSLKILARDLNIPVVCLAQLNRGPENDKREPQLSDLRECLVGDSKILDADTGERVPIRDVVADSRNISVWAVDERLSLVKRKIVRSWSAGRKPVFRVKTKTGREIRCTSLHKFLTVNGWATLESRKVGDEIALPRVYHESQSVESVTPDRAILLGLMIGNGYIGGTPSLTVPSVGDAEFAEALGRRCFDMNPYTIDEHRSDTAKKVVYSMGRMCGAKKNPFTRWLREIGVWGKRAANKSVPPIIFQQPIQTIRGILTGLFHSDGTVVFSSKGSGVQVKFCSISESLVRDVQHLLIRCGIASTVRSDNAQSGGYRTSTSLMWECRISDRSGAAKFIDEIGFLCDKQKKALAIVRTKQNDAGTVDRLPLDVNEYVTKKRNALGMSHAGLGWRDQGKRMSRETAAMIGQKWNDEKMTNLSKSDVFWDEIISIREDGEEETFDVEVEYLHNFCVDDFITHNSGAIEQDADTVLMLHRPNAQDDLAPTEPIDLFVRKQRAGPIGKCRLIYRKANLRFENAARTIPGM